MKLINDKVKSVLNGSLYYDFEKQEFYKVLNQKIELIYVPKGLKEIKDGAFFNHNAIREVHIPASVKKIGNNVFTGCANLEKVIFEGGCESFGENLFKACTSLRTVDFGVSPKNKTVVHLGKNAFSGCSELDTVKLPEGLIEVPDNCFYGCKNLTNVILPNSVLAIRENAFRMCNEIHIKMSKAITPVDVQDNALDCVKAYLYIPQETMQYFSNDYRFNNGKSIALHSVEDFSKVEERIKQEKLANSSTQKTLISYVEKEKGC